MSIRGISFTIAAAFVGMAVTAPQAHAGFIILFAPVGNNVVATGSGTLNISALTSQGPYNPGSADVDPSADTTWLGSGIATIYGTATGPSNFGSTISVSLTAATTGNFVGITDGGASGGERIIVPQGYTSGAALSDSATWSNKSLAALGLTDGIYTYTWGSGATADSFTIEVVPEPSSLTLFAIGSLAIALALLRRRHIAH